MQAVTFALAEEIRAYIDRTSLNHNDRLPAERELGALFGVSRGELRKSLAVLEADGVIWRHVGRGTFVGARPVLNLSEIAYLGKITSPAQVIAARLAIEPELARLAAIYASRADIERIRSFALRGRQATDWRSYEAADNNMHQGIAQATHNKLLVYLFDTLNVVRRSTVWGQLRTGKLPPSNHGSFDEHDAILAAIEAHDGNLAALRMRNHLISVRERILPSLS